MLTTNSLLNHIHEWNQPTQPVMTRMGLTRLGGVVCSAVEVVELFSSGLSCIKHTCERIKQTVVHVFYFLQMTSGRNTKEFVISPSLTKELWEICKRVVGVISTVIFGVLAPSLNFNIHIKLRLTIDHLALLKAKQEENQRQTEARIEKITKMRAEHIASANQKRQELQHGLEESQRIDGALADFLLPVEEF